MHDGKRQKSGGFTLVEVLVVLAVVAVISAIAIPGLAKLGAFSRDEFKRTVVEVDSLLRAAQIYATTYHVNTAVVYNLDNYSASEAAGADTTPSDEDPSDPAVPIPAGSAIIDSLTGVPVRQIEAAALMYELPSTMGDNLKGRFVPISGEMGIFQPLPPGMSIMLQNPEELDYFDASKYLSLYTEFDRSNYRSTALENRIGSLGMSRITAALGLPVGVTDAQLKTFASDPTNFVEETFAAHVFRPSGRISIPRGGPVFNPDPECGDCSLQPLDCDLCEGERFTLYIGPSADRPLDERLVRPDLTDLTDLILPDGTSNLMYRKIYLYKSTGRVSVPDEF